MQISARRTRSSKLLLGMILLFGSTKIASGAEQTLVFPDDRPTAQLDTMDLGYDAGFTFGVDNDLFASGRDDRDYTGGFSITIARSSDSVSPISRFLHSRMDTIESSTEDFLPQQETMQIGLLVFTPDDISATQPVRNDRPYSSLLFISTTSHALGMRQDKLTQSGLTIGILGTNVAKEIQTAIHRQTASFEPKGYHHQISDGGELTVQYRFSRHALLSEDSAGGLQRDLKFYFEGAVGFLTEASAGIDFRFGRVATPWWSSISNYAHYAAKPAPPTPYRGRKDLYLFAGIRGIVRAYNVFLQGQLRDSDVTHGSSDLHRLLSEAWVGFATDFDSLRVTYALRFQTPEFRRGPAARYLRWAGVSFSRRFR